MSNEARQSSPRSAASVVTGRPPSSVSQSEFERVYERYILGSDFFEGTDYYHRYQDRYRRTFRWIDRLLPRGGRMLDIGSGQFAVLSRRLLDASCDVADIDNRYTRVLADNGIGFLPLDLSQTGVTTDTPYDLIVMAEVIEHVPTPPHVVFSRLLPALRPGGRLLLTTPNLYRLRNVLRLATGQHLFDYFMQPGPNRPLGHFVEYAQEQLEWQLREASFVVEESRLEQLSFGASSPKARLARRALAPLLMLRPLWRDNLVLVARRPD